MHHFWGRKKYHVEEIEEKVSSVHSTIADMISFVMAENTTY